MGGFAAPRSPPDHMAGLDDLADLLPERLSIEKLLKVAGVQSGDEVLNITLRVNSERSDLAEIGLLLPQLQELRFQESLVTSIRDLGTSLTALRVLHLRGVGLRELDGVAALGNLRELDVRGNFLSDLTPLATQEQLQVLRLGSNRVVEVAELEILGTVPLLYDLGLAPNPVCDVDGVIPGLSLRAAVCTFVPQLRVLDGKSCSDEDLQGLSPAQLSELAAEALLLCDAAEGPSSLGDSSHTDPAALDPRRKTASAEVNPHLGCVPDTGSDMTQGGVVFAGNLRSSIRKRNKGGLAALQTPASDGVDWLQEGVIFNASPTSGTPSPSMPDPRSEKPRLSPLLKAGAAIDRPVTTGDAGVKVRAGKTLARPKTSGLARRSAWKSSGTDAAAERGRDEAQEDAKGDGGDAEVGDEEGQWTVGIARIRVASRNAWEASVAHEASDSDAEDERSESGNAHGTSRRHRTRQAMVSDDSDDDSGDERPLRPSRARLSEAKNTSSEEGFNEACRHEQHRGSMTPGQSIVVRPPSSPVTKPLSRGEKRRQRVASRLGFDLKESLAAIDDWSEAMEDHDRGILKIYRGEREAGATTEKKQAPKAGAKPKTSEYRKGVFDAQDQSVAASGKKPKPEGPESSADVQVVMDPSVGNDSDKVPKPRRVKGAGRYVAGQALEKTDEELVQLLKRPPKYVPELRTRESFRRFFAHTDKARMLALLHAAYADRDEVEREHKVRKRLALVVDLLC